MPTRTDTRISESTAVVLVTNFGPSVQTLQFDNLVECLDYIKGMPEARTGDWLNYAIHRVMESGDRTDVAVEGYYSTCLHCDKRIVSLTGHPGQWLALSRVGNPGSSFCASVVNRHNHQPGNVVVRHEGDESLLREALAEARDTARAGSLTAEAEAKNIMKSMATMGMVIPVDSDYAKREAPWHEGCRKCVELVEMLYASGPTFSVMDVAIRHLGSAHEVQVGDV